MGAAGTTRSFEVPVRQRETREPGVAGGVQETFTYDSLGRRTGMANAEVSITNVYDALNRLTSATNHTLGQTITSSRSAGSVRRSAKSGTRKIFIDFHHFFCYNTGTEVNIYKGFMCRSQWIILKHTVVK